MKRQNIFEVRETLREAGVPPHVIVYVTEGLSGTLPSNQVSFLLLGALVFAFSCIFGLWSFLQDLNKYLALSTARNIEAILVDMSNFGLSMIVLMFASIFCAVIITMAISLRVAKFARLTFINSVLDSRRFKLDRLVLGRAPRNENLPADQYVRAGLMRQMKFCARAAAVLGLIAVAILLCELRSHPFFSEHAYVHTPFLPWEAATSHAWNSAVSVDTACLHTSGSRGSDENDIVYRVTFDDGTSVDLGRSIAVDVPWLDAMEAIDRKIESAGAQFGVRAVKDGTPFDPPCLAAQWERFTPDDFERAMRLIRYGG